MSHNPKSEAKQINAMTDFEKVGEDIAFLIQDGLDHDSKKSKLKEYLATQPDGLATINRYIMNHEGWQKPSQKEEERQQLIKNLVVHMDTKVNPVLEISLNYCEQTEIKHPGTLKYFVLLHKLGLADTHKPGASDRLVEWLLNENNTTLTDQIMTASHTPYAYMLDLLSGIKSATTYEKMLGYLTSKQFLNYHKKLDIKDFRVTNNRHNAILCFLQTLYIHILGQNTVHFQHYQPHIDRIADYTRENYQSMVVDSVPFIGVFDCLGFFYMFFVERSVPDQQENLLDVYLLACEKLLQSSALHVVGFLESVLIIFPDYAEKIIHFFVGKTYKALNRSEAGIKVRGTFPFFPIAKSLIGEFKDPDIQKKFTAEKLVNSFFSSMHKEMTPKDKEHSLKLMHDLGTEFKPIVEAHVHLHLFHIMKIHQELSLPHDLNRWLAAITMHPSWIPLKNLPRTAELLLTVPSYSNLSLFKQARKNFKDKLISEFSSDANKAHKIFKASDPKAIKMAAESKATYAMQTPIKDAYCDHTAVDLPPSLI